MPTFSAITLDRLLEPRASKSVDKSLPPKPASNSSFLPNSKLERRNSTSVAERKVHRPLLKPSLYTTPEPTPLPDSPSSFPPSPYIINHKRRGARLLKSFSEKDVSSHNKTSNEAKVNDDKIEPEVSEVNNDTLIAYEHVNGNHDDGSSGIKIASGHLGSSIGELGSSNINGDLGSNALDVSSYAEKDCLKLITSVSERSRDAEDFFDLQESMSFTSNTDGEDNGADHSGKINTSVAEFFDAWEELSSEGGRQPSILDTEGELREMRLSLSMEIEKRKQAEETLSKMQRQWQRFKEQLTSAGLNLHADSTFVGEREQFNSDHVVDLCQQVYLARFVSDSIGRGTMRAEMETAMEAQMDAKNFEISRLLDRLNYYEAVNREMSQRNQESVDSPGREAEKKRRQKWVWGSVAAAITVGTSAIAWSYFPSSSSSSSSRHLANSTK